IFHDNISLEDRGKLYQFAHFRFSSLTEDEGWNRIKEYIKYQDDLWDNPSPSINISSISEGAHETNECDQNKPTELVCLSGGDIYDDPSLEEMFFAVIWKKEEEAFPTKEGEDQGSSCHIPLCLFGPVAGSKKIFWPILFRRHQVKSYIVIKTFMPIDLSDTMAFLQLKPNRMRYSALLELDQFKYPSRLCENLLDKGKKGSSSLVWIFVNSEFLEMDTKTISSDHLGMALPRHRSSCNRRSRREAKSENQK
ncbi:hypothetical protein Tco_1170968, partial [Tanacetum coccineum]